MLFMNEGIIPKFTTYVDLIFATIITLIYSIYVAF
jgi:hypothetical protein